MSPFVTVARAWADRIACLGSQAALALVLVPMLLTRPGATTWTARHGATTAVAALAAAVVHTAGRRRGRAIGLIGRLTTSVLVIELSWLLPQVHDDPLAWLASALIGVGAALLARPQRARRADRSMGAPSGAAVLVTVTAVVAAALTGWVGANAADVRWFGSLIHHGPRDSGEVAITFDDGPNTTGTLQIADLLDARGIKATFFFIGASVIAQPDLARRLDAAGHLIGNHSFHHDETRWLDPRYLELGRAERAIASITGRCPAFFRPPHGQHTPFMAKVVDDAGMTMFGWDVSATDWVGSDPAVIARRVLAKVRGGSIIDLHDGLDTDTNADRSTLVAAVPLILDGLKAKGLTPIRLDELVGRPGYLQRC